MNTEEIESKSADWRRDKLGKNAVSSPVSCLRVLKLTLSKSPFDVMHTGEKQTEFRKPSEWIESRLYDKEGNEKEYDLVEFINGYGSDKPVFVAKYLGFARAEADYSISYSNGLNVEVEKGDYKIYLGQVIKIANLRAGGC
jgi:hypothetical protein